MLTKKYLRKFINYLSKDKSPQEKVELVISLMEARGREILKREKDYEDLYIDPQVDILNSKPQVIQQVHDELLDFLTVLRANNTHSILQIGLGHFASTHFALSFLMDKIVTIEYDQEHISRYLNELNQENETLIHGDSTDADIISEALEANGGQEFDAVFIDGNHSYEYVKKDLENYKELVKTGGIVALHDANFEGDRYGTPQVIREFDTLGWNFISHSEEVGIAYFIKK